MSQRTDLGKAGPHGYIHGWIKVGAGGDDRAASLHGKEVAGDLGGGRGVVIGTYNHQAGTVRSHRTGTDMKVTAVNGERGEAGFHGETSSAHLPSDVRQAMGAYDQAIRGGATPEAPGIRTGPGTPPAPRVHAGQPAAPLPHHVVHGPAAHGFRGDVASSHLPARTRQGMQAYDRAIAAGVDPHALEARAKAVFSGTYEDAKREIILAKLARLLP